MKKRLDSSMTSEQEPRRMTAAEAERATEEMLLSEQTRVLSSPDAVRQILKYSLTVGYAQTEAQRLGKLEEFKRVVGEANSRMHETGPDAVIEAIVSVIGEFEVPPEWQVGSGTAAPEEDDNV